MVENYPVEDYVLIVDIITKQHALMHQKATSLANNEQLMVGESMYGRVDFHLAGMCEMWRRLNSIEQVLYIEE